MSAEAPPLPRGVRDGPDGELRGDVDNVAALGGVKAKMIAMSMEIEDKAQTIALLQESLRKARVSLEAEKRQAATTLKQRLGKQKETYDSVIKRHLQFADTLLADKQELSEKVDALSKELMTVEQAWETRLKAAKERAAVDLKRAKDAWSAAERVRRDAWMKEKTKLIRDATVKGLEPEVQRILDRQKAEIAKLRDEAEEKLSRRAADLEARHAEELARVKLSVQSQVQAGLEREKVAFTSRERELRLEFEEQYKALRQRSIEDSEADQKRHHELMREERERHLQETNRLRAMYEDQMLRRDSAQHETAKQREEREMQERTKWRRAMELELKQDMAKREEDIRREMARQRDDQIKMVIARLDAEMRQGKHDQAAEWQKRLQAAEEKHKEEVRRLQVAADTKSREVEEQHKMALRDLRNRIAELERQRNSEASATVETHQKQTKAMEKLQGELNRATRETEELRKALAESREHMATQAGDMERMRADHRRISGLMADSDSLREQEVSKLKAQHEEALRSTEARLQQQIEAQEAQIRALQETLEETEVRRQQAELLLAKQRQELVARLEA